jgi:hypothetical protein
MNIAGYRFGRIDIDGRMYRSDVIITPERVIDGWWRQLVDGHGVTSADQGAMAYWASTLVLRSRGGWRGMVGADGFERRNDLVVSQRFVGARREHQVVHRDDADQGTVLSDGQPPDPLRCHRVERHVHIVVRPARPHFPRGHVANRDL